MYINKFLRKEASTNVELIGANGLGGNLGALIGLCADPAKEDHLNKTMGEVKNLFIPGVGGYRLARRRTGEAKKLGADKTKAVSELLGGATSGIPRNVLAGLASQVHPIAGVGALALPSVAAAIAALATKTRTEEEQKDYEHSTAQTILNYLLPGMAEYNMFKSIGYMQDQDNKRRALNAELAKLREAEKSKKAKKD